MATCKGICAGKMAAGEPGLSSHLLAIAKGFSLDQVPGSAASYSLHMSGLKSKYSIRKCCVHGCAAAVQQVHQDCLTIMSRWWWFVWQDYLYGSISIPYR